MPPTTWRVGARPTTSTNQSASRSSGNESELPRSVYRYALTVLLGGNIAEAFDGSFRALIQFAVAGRAGDEDISHVAVFSDRIAHLHCALHPCVPQSLRVFRLGLAQEYCVV